MNFDHSLPSAPRAHRALRLGLVGVVTVAISMTDTTTRYEVAVAVFYTVVIYTSAGVLTRRWLLALAASCIVLTSVSFAFTPRGDLSAGLINMGISMVAIVMISVLVLRAEAAKVAAHDAQARLMKIAWVKSLESLTTSIAHEINQPLAAIVTSGNACQRWLAQDPPNLQKANQALQRILDDAGRASTIIARVRSLTRGEPPSKSEFDFNKAVAEIVALSRAEMECTRICLELNLSPDLPFAYADRVQIQQTIGNLVLNSIQALAFVPATKRSIRIASESRDDFIILTVHDTGAGIPEGYYEHLFEAFWTSKEEGIGVGLSISRAIIEANGGQIWAEPNDGTGAIFRFSTPAIFRKRK